MWQRVRRWHLVAGVLAIAIAGVIIAIRWTGGGRLDAAGMAAYLPQRTSALGYIDVAAIRNSGLLEKLVGSTVGEEPEYKSFIQRTGFDYKRDLDSVILSSASGIHYFLLKGRFDWNKLKSYAVQEGGKCRDDYCFVAGSTPGRVISFYPVRPTLIALASAATENAAHDISRRPPQKLLFEIPDKPVWLQAPAALLRDQQQMPAGTRLFMKALEVAEHLTATIGPAGDAFEIALDVTCKTEQDAAIMKSQLEGLTAFLGKMIMRENQRANPADLSGVLTSGVFQRENRHVLGKWPIRKAFLDSLGGS